MNNLVSIAAIQKRMAIGVPKGRSDEPTVRRLWWAALDTLQEEILLPLGLTRGLWFSSPLPALYEPRLLNRLRGWVWAPDQFGALQYQKAGLLPSSSIKSITQFEQVNSVEYNRLNLREEDGFDPLLIIITPEIQVAMSLMGERDTRNLVMRSDSETLKDLLQMLDDRLYQEDQEQANQIRQSLEDLGQLKTNDNFANIFWPLLSAKLANIAPSLNIQALSTENNNSASKIESCREISLLEALTHEIKTPLATIRTLIRSILKRQDVNELVVSRLKEIDSECTEQIDRFGLIFNAVELERRKSKRAALAKTDLGNLLNLFYPSWSKQLERRGVKLILDITPDLPEVRSDAEGLEMMLWGLIDRNTRGIQYGSALTLQLRPAGQRLKLKISSDLSLGANSEHNLNETNSSLGTVLSWDPNTGILQLSKGATQRLLASLGGRIANRKDSGLTIFFPIEEND